MENLNIAIILYGLSQLDTLIRIIMPLLKYIATEWLGYGIYQIKSKEMKTRIYNNIENYYCSTKNEERKPVGWVINKEFPPKYILLEDDNNSYWMQVFCKTEIYETLIKTDSDKSFEKINLTELKVDKEFDTIDEEGRIENKNKLSLLYRTGDYGYINYVPRETTINYLNFNKNQKQLFVDVMDHYNKTGFAKVLITGDMGSGKTLFSYMLAHKIDGIFCDSFDPTEPSVTLDMLYATKKSKRPLVILMDEIDVIINKIHNNEIKPHKHFPIMVNSKQTWNMFLDKIEHGLYPYMIIIMTSNKSVKELCQTTDDTYLRDGRINIKSSFKGKHVKSE